MRINVLSCCFLLVLFHARLGVGAGEQLSPLALGDEKSFFEALNLDQPGLEPVRSAVAAGDWSASKQAWAAHLAARKSPHWVWSRHDRPELLRVEASRFGGMARYTNEADRVLARDFKILGVRKQLEHHPEWLHGTIEWTHVLSRFGYWRDLGYAWWATGDPKYSSDFVYLLKTWIADNPVPAKPSTSRGTNGSVWRTLEAGIRADTWFDAAELFMDAPEFDAQAKYLMTRSLVEHARYLAAWTKSYRAGNWQVCEAGGLTTIGIMLPEFKEAAGWRELGLQYLTEHMRRDVEPDGAHHELTPGYHTWVMLQFLKIGLLARENGCATPGLLDRHEKMFEFLMKLRQPSGYFVTVGDAGYARERNTVAPFLGLGALMYGRKDMRYLGSNEPSESWLWLFGPGIFRKYEALEATPPAFTSALLPNAQYAIMRTGWDESARFLFFDCAPWRGGHSHQDRLQVVVSAGRDLLVDPGMFSYDQPLSRSYFRKSEAHNVLLIDGAEQPSSDPQLVAWHTSSEADFASGRIEQKGLRHQRSVLFVKPQYWVVVDHIEGEGEHELTRLFHFPAKASVSTRSKAVETTFKTGSNIRVEALDDAQIQMREGWIPVSEATAVNAPVAIFSARKTLPATLCTVLTPFERRDELPKLKLLNDADTRMVKLQVEFANGQHDEVAIAATTSALKVGAREGNGLATAVRRGPTANSVATIKAGLQQTVTDSQ